MDKLKALLDRILAVHGGVDRWQSFQAMKARVKIGGLTWTLKGHPGVLDDIQFTGSLHRQEVRWQDIFSEGIHSSFTPSKVALLHDAGQEIESLVDPRDSFAGHVIETPWSRLQLVYFCSYATWNYLTAPFHFLMPGIQLRLMEPWQEKGEVWERIEAIYPPAFATHSRRQVFYYDGQGHLRRHDYWPEVLGGSSATQIIEDYRSFQGVSMGTKRRIYILDDADGSYRREPVLVSIDVVDVAFTGYAAMAETKTILVDGVEYAYRRMGEPSGVPLVCFQHFTGTLDNWDPAIVDALAARREVILFDNRGVGGSSGETPEKVAAMTQDAIKWIDALGLKQVDILGFSLGGFIAQYLVHLRPDLVRKLILVGTAPQGVKVLHQFPALIERAMKLDPVERFLFIFFTSSEKSRAKGMAALQRMMERKADRDPDATQASVIAQLKAITAWGVDAPDFDVADIRQPVLLVQGSHDEMMDSDNSYALFKRLPNAVLQYYPDAAHGSYYQYPAHFAQQANYFLDNYR